MESRGVVTATIVTSGFAQAAQAHRRLLKRPDLAYFVVPHPIVSMDADALDAAADAIFDALTATIAEALPSAGANSPGADR